MSLPLPKPLATTGLRVVLTPSARRDRDRMWNPLISNAVAEAIRANGNAAFAKAAASHRMSVLGHRGNSARKVAKKAS